MGSDQSNLLVVSDLHFGEQLLPGASVERCRAVELADQAFRAFLRYHAARRRDGRPWRLVVAGDLFDFMSIVVDGTADAPAPTPDEERYGLHRGSTTGVERMRRLCAAHQPFLIELVRFAAAGHEVDLVAGNHDVELLMPEVAAEFHAQLARVGIRDRADAAVKEGLARIRVVPWFVHVPGVAWIEHGHVYDEGCSFEFNLAPCDPRDGRLVYNADYAAMRYLGTTLPEVDPSAVEEWSFLGFLTFAWGLGVRSFGRVIAAYARFAGALVTSRTQHQSPRRRDRRRREHRDRLAQVAVDTSTPLDTLAAVDRLARTPLTVSWRRLGRMLMLDRFGIAGGMMVAILAMLVMLPLGWAIAGGAVVVAAGMAAARMIGKHMILSQLPMRSVPRRLHKLVGAPVIVFGHTHDPRVQSIHKTDAVYVNSGTWLPATKPGLRRSFTHVMIQPCAGAAPRVELRQWRDGASLPFEAKIEPELSLTTTGAHVAVRAS